MWLAAGLAAVVAAVSMGLAVAVMMRLRAARLFGLRPATDRVWRLAFDLQPRERVVERGAVRE